VSSSWCPLQMQPSLRPSAAFTSEPQHHRWRGISGPLHNRIVSRALSGGGLCRLLHGAEAADVAQATRPGRLPSFWVMHHPGRVEGPAVCQGRHRSPSGSSDQGFRKAVEPQSHQHDREHQQARLDHVAERTSADAGLSWNSTIESAKAGDPEPAAPAQAHATRRACRTTRLQTCSRPRR